MNEELKQSVGSFLYKYREGVSKDSPAFDELEQLITQKQQEARELQRWETVVAAHSELLGHLEKAPDGGMYSVERLREATRADLEIAKAKLAELTKQEGKG